MYECLNANGKFKLIFKIVLKSYNYILYKIYQLKIIVFIKNLNLLEIIKN